uniref:Caspase-8-like n=1 Tax=Crassostrea virginica TaxID=6565 RepID=A0A8B8AUC6_CRAVI|nr:caspase-8-like [Crassostrea virginica]
MEESFNRFDENSLNHCQNVTTKLMFLAKDVIPEAVREKMKQGQVRSALETNVVSLWFDGKDPPFGFIKEWLLMEGEELFNIRDNDMFDEYCHVDSAGISEKRKMLYKVGEKTEKHQLNALKAILLSQGVEDEIQDESMGIWKCLDLLEDCLEEEEFFSLLKVVYKKDVQSSQLLTDFLNGSFTTGAIGGQIDKYPIQEIGDKDHRYSDAYPQTDKIRESVLLSNVLPSRDRFSMSPDEIKMGSTKPQSSQLLVYDRGKHPGLCVIFNNKTFVKESIHPTRDGTDKDKDSLEHMFKTYGYEVFVYNDKSCSEILKILATFQSRDHQVYGAFIVCTLSHGDLDVISGSCVWPRTDNSFPANSDTNLTNGKQDMTATVPDFYQMCFGPAEADFLIAHSTMPGYVSLRNEDGSYFIQSLVKNIKEHSPR